MGEWIGLERSNSFPALITGTETSGHMIAKNESLKIFRPLIGQIFQFLCSYWLLIEGFISSVTTSFRMIIWKRDFLMKIIWNYDKPHLTRWVVQPPPPLPKEKRLYIILKAIFWGFKRQWLFNIWCGLEPFMAKIFINQRFIYREHITS